MCVLLCSYFKLHWPNNTLAANLQLYTRQLSGEKKNSSTLVRVKKKLPDKKCTKTWNISGLKGIMKIQNQTHDS